MRKWIGKSEGAAPKKKSKLIEKKTNIIKVYSKIIIRNIRKFSINDIVNPPY